MPQGLLVVPGEWLQRNIAGHIKGMAGLAGGGEAQGPETTPLQQGQHLLIAPPPGPLVAPAQPHRRLGIGYQPLLRPAIGLGAHRIGGAAQHGRRWADAGKQVEHLQAAEAPVLGKAHQPPQGGIVALATGPRRIEADENQSWRRRLPQPLQPPAVKAAGAEGGGAADDGLLHYRLSMKQCQAWLPFANNAKVPA